MSKSRHLPLSYLTLVASYEIVGVNINQGRMSIAITVLKSMSVVYM